MNSSLTIRCTLVGAVLLTIGLAGCPGPIEQKEGAKQDREMKTEGGEETTAEKSAPEEQKPPARVATAKAEDVAAAKKLLDSFGPSASYTIVPDGVLTEISVEDGSKLKAEDMALFGRLTDLSSLEILNYRDLTDDLAAELSGLKGLTTLALTNSAINDPTADMIAKSFPALTELDLSSNADLTGEAVKSICGLTNLERLALLQNRFNDLDMRSLRDLEKLKVLDLRGNMQVGDRTMMTLGKLPNLVALKHRSSTVSDYGIELLSSSESLESLLMQDFGIGDDAGASLANMKQLKQLEIFRCQGFGSGGVLALKGMPLTRLQLRGLPSVDDSAMEVFNDLPKLERLYIQEIDSVSDEGLKSLANLQELRVLDVWAVPQMGDATVDVIAQLPKLTELSIRVTGVTDASIDKLLAMPALKKLTFKDNGSVTADGLSKLAEKEWGKLDTGQ
jgi:Leucine-rich repeat (LRR) protein